MGLSMDLPESYDEFKTRFRDAQEHDACDLNSGRGMPCPFCAAPGFTTYPIFDHEAKKLPHPPLFCAECKRIALFIFECRELAPNVHETHFGVLQVSGPVQPKWLVPSIGWVQ